MAVTDVANSVKSSVGRGIDRLGTLALSPPRTSFGSVLNHGSRDRRTVALTFDDGPAKPSTEWTLDALDAAGVPGTFFCIGAMVEEHPDVVRRMVDTGHEVGSHSMAHSRKDATSFGDTDHLDLAGDVLERVTGVRPRLYRPPWGWLTPWERRRAEARGMRVIGWDVYPDDWKLPEPPASDTARFVCDRVQPGSIVLLHDGASHLMDCSKTETAASIPLIVDELTEQGYTFVTVSEQLGLDRTAATSASAPGT